MGALVQTLAAPKAEPETIAAAVAEVRRAALAPTDALARLRVPFTGGQINRLPKPTKQQTDDVKADFKKGIRCDLCGSWHHPNVVHLDYVGHAALTDRLLDTDIEWFWEPLAYRDGLPAFDGSGGLWIKLTICGVTRLGYGNAAGKVGQDPGAREKEVIGDALRNAGMRFGAALDLWHKGDLHGDAEAGDSTGDAPAPATRKSDKPKPEPRNPEVAVAAAKAMLDAIDHPRDLMNWEEDNRHSYDDLSDDAFEAIKQHFVKRQTALNKKERA